MTNTSGQEVDRAAVTVRHGIGQVLAVGGVPVTSSG